MTAAKNLRMQSLFRLYLSLQTPAFMGLRDDSSLCFSTIAQSARSQASSVHGLGIFAARTLPPGSIAAFYPAHALGDTSRRFEADTSTGTVGSNFGGTTHRPYRVALPASPGLVAWDADDLWVDVDPSVASLDGWCGHLVNDAAMVAKMCSEADVCAYYESSCVPCVDE